MEVKLLNIEKGELKKEGSMYTVYYKPLAYKQSSEITLEISDIQLKDTQETIQLSSNEAIQPGQTSTLYAAKAPASGNVDDIEVLK